MQARFLSFSLLAATLLCLPPARAATENQNSAIEKLGSLNGTALHCRYLNETGRIKKALASTLPKQRTLGQAFEESTNKSFLHSMQQKSACPEAPLFSQQVDQAIQALQAAFERQ